MWSSFESRGSKSRRWMQEFFLTKESIRQIQAHHAETNCMEMYAVYCFDSCSPYLVRILALLWAVIFVGEM